MLLENKVAVITGIGPGLGRELAVQFAREGAAVVIGARTESYLEEVRKEIDADGGRVVAVPTDIAQRGKPRDELYAEIASNIALGVIPTDEECVGAALFLASDLASMVTGQSIDVNGGEVFV